jgi:hypothetical protein
MGLRTLAVQGCCSFLLLTQAAAPVATARDDSKASDAPEKKFESLLAEARKNPKKTDWKGLRHSFAETSHYNPYDFGRRKEMAAIGDDIRDGKLGVAEAGLLTLLEREGWMRHDSHAMAVALYERMGQPEKAHLHREFADGIWGAILVPGHGASTDKPIEVLFIEEEYMVVQRMGLKPKGQRLMEVGGHHFDVLTTEGTGDGPDGELYFNIDVPQQALFKALQPRTSPK